MLLFTSEQQERIVKKAKGKRFKIGTDLLRKQNLQSFLRTEEIPLQIVGGVTMTDFPTPAFIYLDL